jgi:putative transposase
MISSAVCRFIVRLPAPRGHRDSHTTWTSFWGADHLGIAQVCQRLGVSEPTLHRWRNQYGGLKQDEAKRLRELEAENARLKRLVAELALDKQMLQEVAQKKW